MNTPDQPTATATPRTDEAEFFMSTSDKQSPDEGCMMVEAYFARTLERELSSAQAALAEAKAEVARLDENLDKLTCDNTAIRERLCESHMQLKTAWGRQTEMEKVITALRAEVDKLKEALFIKYNAFSDKASERFMELRAEVARLQFSITTGAIDMAALRARVAELEADKARLVEQSQRDNDACKKLSGFTFEELSWEFERLKNNLLNSNQQIEDANHIIGLFFEACSETNVGLFHERLGAAFEKSKKYRAAIDAAKGQP